MDTADRLTRMAEIEMAVADLVEDGWRVERIASEDERDKPFVVVITLSIDSNDENRGVL